MLGIRGMPPNLLIIPNYPACAAYYEYHLHHTSDTTPADTVDTPLDSWDPSIVEKVSNRYKYRGQN